MLWWCAYLRRRAPRTSAVYDEFSNVEVHYNITYKINSLTKKSSPVTGQEWPRGFQEVKVPRFHDNGTGWW